MKQLFLAPVALFLFCLQASADMYPDASNAKLPDARTNLAIAPHVATNAALTAASTVTYPSGVWRDDFATGNGAPPLWYQPETGTCAANSRVNDGGSCVNAAGSNSFFAVFPATGGDIREWGAACKGGDDTAAVNNAFASGVNPVLWPPLPCTVTTLNALPANTTLRGAGPRASTIVTSSAAGNVISLTNNDSAIDNIGFNSSVTRTAGWYVALNAANVSLTNFLMQNAYGAVLVFDVTSNTRVDHGHIFNSVGSSQAVVQYGTGTATGTVAAYFGHTLIDGNTTPPFTYNAVHITNAGDVLMEDVQALQATTDVLINPGNGQVVASFKCSHSFADHGGNGWLLQPTGTGTIVRAQFTDCWGASVTANAYALIGGAGAGIDGVQFVNCQSLLSVTGIAVTGNVKHVSWIGGIIAANSNAGIIDSRSSTYNDFKVIGAQIGAGNGLGGNGLALSLGGAGDYLALTNNNVIGNTTALSNTNTGTHNRIVNNDGINPQGNLSPTVGSSPWTMPPIPYPSTAYVFGGTLSNVLVNGQIYFGASGAPLVVPLQPSDVLKIVYTVAPTVTVAQQ